MFGTNQLRCSLCSRDFLTKDVRQSPRGVLCHDCWSAICPQPWPKDDSAHGGISGVTFGGGRPDGLAAASAKAAAEEAAAAAHEAHRLTMQRRSSSMASIPSMAMAGRRAAGRLPNSMPEHHGGLLSGSSAEDPRWAGALAGQAGSAPGWRVPPHSLGAAPDAPPTFSPVELRNMLHEQSLELFESQSHLLDPESRAALQRQRQYLQWQSSLEEPGPMASVLERQESAGSGCLDDDEDLMPGTAAAAGGGGGGGGSVSMGMGGHRMNGGGGGGSVGNGGGGQPLLHELQEARRLLAVVSREREALATRVAQLEAEMAAQQEAVMCRACRAAPRNCVVLPCLHFTSCDGCFKKHCAATLACPMCNGRVTGFQTLLML